MLGLLAVLGRQRGRFMVHDKMISVCFSSHSLVCCGSTMDQNLNEVKTMCSEAWDVKARVLGWFAFGLGTWEMETKFPFSFLSEIEKTKRSRV